MIDNYFVFLKLWDILWSNEYVSNESENVNCKKCMFKK